MQYQYRGEVYNFSAHTEFYSTLSDFEIGFFTKDLFYCQLYIALQRKTKNKLTGAAMETMRAAAPVNLEKIESGLYKHVRTLYY